MTKKKRGLPCIKTLCYYNDFGYCTEEPEVGELVCRKEKADPKVAEAENADKKRRRILIE